MSFTVSTNRQSPLVSMATSLSGPLSETGGCLISQRFALAAVSGRPLQKPRMKSSGVCVLNCSAFGGSDRFTAAVSIRLRQEAIVSCLRNDLDCESDPSAHGPLLHMLLLRCGMSIASGIPGTARIVRSHFASDRHLCLG